jgi:hypothetical protein
MLEILWHFDMAGPIWKGEPPSTWPFVILSRNSSREEESQGSFGIDEAAEFPMAGKRSIKRNF